MEILASIVGVAAGVGAGAMWRGNKAAEAVFRPFWGSRDEVTVRAWLRCAPVVFSVVALLAIGAAISSIVDNSATPGIFGVFILAAMILVGIIVTIFFYNKPRMFAAPHMREEHGALAMWKDRRESRRNEST